MAIFRRDSPWLYFAVALIFLLFAANYVVSALRDHDNIRYVVAGLLVFAAVGWVRLAFRAKRGPIEPEHEGKHWL